ncbi:MAG: XkdX family protein [Lentihominibacter sp.]
MHSARYEKVKSYYEKGLWLKKMVHNAVIKEWITAEEYKEITGEEFTE